MTVREDDEQLIQRVYTGDQYAETELFQRYYRDVFWEARRRGLGEADAEDVASSVLCTMFENVKARRLKGTIRPWLMKVTRNRATDCARQDAQEKRYRLFPEHPEDLVTSTEDKEKRVISYPEVLVRRALMQIREKETKLVKSTRGWSYGEIIGWISKGHCIEDMARWMKTTDNTTRQRKLRALRMLKKEIEKLQAEISIAGSQTERRDA